MRMEKGRSDHLCREGVKKGNRAETDKRRIRAMISGDAHWAAVLQPRAMTLNILKTFISPLQTKGDAKKLHVPVLGPVQFPGLA
jgi:hypothetical protein